MIEHAEDAVTLAVLKLEVEHLREDVAKLQKSTQALVEAWNAAGIVIRFIKIIASTVAAIGVIWLFVKHGRIE